MSLFYIRTTPNLRAVNTIKPVKAESQDNRCDTIATVPTGAARIVAFVLVAVALIAWATPPVALMAGMIFTLCVGNPFHKWGHKLAKRLLQICVVMLGFGMNLPTILRAGWNGSLFAALTIGSTLLLG